MADSLGEQESLAVAVRAGLGHPSYYKVKMGTHCTGERSCPELTSEEGRGMSPDWRIPCFPGAALPPGQWLERITALRERLGAGSHPHSVPAQ